MPRIRKYLTALKHVTIVALLLTSLIACFHFPLSVDAPLTPHEIEAAARYYASAYQEVPAANASQSKFETEYIGIAESSAKLFSIEERIRAFVNRYSLHQRPVLEIGSGRGDLQHLAQDYTGLDISPTVARFYHKKFMLGSATALPFPDDSFDGVWSIWVFEHVPNPEQAFREARRVTRDQGVIFLMPAWNCPSWLGEGYHVRPYSDLTLGGKIIKASIPLRTTAYFRAAALLPVRFVRRLAGYFGPTALRYHRLTPNYETYWSADSDAVNSLDSHEALLWFVTRGDECLNCEGLGILAPDQPLVIRVHKR